MPTRARVELYADPRRLGGRKRAPGGRSGGGFTFVELVKETGEMFSDGADAVEGVVDSIGTATCNALASVGINGKPLASAWSSDVVQQIAFLAGFLPPPIMPWPQIATFAGDVVATCTITEAVKRGMCHQRAVFRLLEGVMRSDLILVTAEETGGGAMAEAINALGVLASAGNALVEPVCTGEPPEAEEIVGFAAELAYAVAAVEEAGGPAAFGWLRPILAAAIGEEAVQAIENGASPDEVVGIAMDDYEAGLEPPAFVPGFTYGAGEVIGGSIPSAGEIIAGREDAAEFGGGGGGGGGSSGGGGGGVADVAKGYVIWKLLETFT